MVSRRLLISTVLMGASTAILSAQTGPQRPPIVGVAHIALKTNDLAEARNFYGRDLGFAELKPAVFKVNDRQYIEVTAELKAESEDRLKHIAFETTNLAQLRDYLASRAVKVPEALKPDLDGNLSMTVQDPDGHNVEFVQYLPGSFHQKAFGKLLPASRISDHIIHVGFTVADRDAADKFYKEILGFHETWHGGMTDTRTDWIDMRVPDGTDWLEYMLNVHNPTPKTLGVMNHLALGVPNVDAAYKRLLERGMNLQSQPPKIGRDGKWQLNLYDPNLTRAELMEPKPVQPPCCSPFVGQVANLRPIANRPL